MAMTDSAPVTIRDVLRLRWEADIYPHLGNEDARVAQRLEAEALALAATAKASADDPPEFGRWLAVLSDPNVTPASRDVVMHALYDLFDPETESAL